MTLALGPGLGLGIGLGSGLSLVLGVLDFADLVTLDFGLMSHYHVISFSRLGDAEPRLGVSKRRLGAPAQARDSQP